MVKELFPAVESAEPATWVALAAALGRSLTWVHLARKKPGWPQAPALGQPGFLAAVRALVPAATTQALAPIPVVQASAPVVQLPVAPILPASVQAPAPIAPSNGGEPQSILALARSLATSPAWVHLNRRKPWWPQTPRLGQPGFLAAVQAAREANIKPRGRPVQLVAPQPVQPVQVVPAAPMQVVPAAPAAPAAPQPVQPVQVVPAAPVAPVQPVVLQPAQVVVPVAIPQALRAQDLEPVEAARLATRLACDLLAVHAENGTLGPQVFGALKTALGELRAAEKGCLELAEARRELIPSAEAQGTVSDLTQRYILLLDSAGSVLPNQVEVWLSDTAFWRLGLAERRASVQQWWETTIASLRAELADAIDNGA